MSANSAIFNPTESTSAATGDGFSCPRLTTVGRLAINFGPGDKGMMVFDTTLNNLFIWNGAAWDSVPGSGDSVDTEVIFNDNGELSGDPGLLYQKSLQRLTVAQNVDIWRGGLNDGTSTAVGSRTLELTAAGATGNTAIGWRAMYRALTASDNVAVGVNALSSNFFSGSGNVAVGNGALAANTTNDIVAIGLSALTANTTGTRNTAVGTFTLASNQTNVSCTAVGFQAALASTADSTNAFGSRALALNTTGAQNCAFGTVALENNIVGSNNAAFGNAALTANLSSDNSAFGVFALSANVNGFQNTAIGRSALGTNINGTRNTAVGFQTLQLSTVGDNTAVGATAGGGLTTGGTNTFIGSAAGSNVTTGGSNICIGVNAGTEAAGSGNQISIGSSVQFVGTNGAANTYFANAVTGTVLPPAGATGFWRVIINGTARKIAVYAD